MWARRAVIAHSCPKGLILGESLRWLEEFNAWKAGAGINLLGLPARTAEAFVVIEQELRAEQNYARQDSQHGTE